jgi:hypothetical protein
MGYHLELRTKPFAHTESDTGQFSFLFECDGLLITGLTDGNRSGRRSIRQDAQLHANSGRLDRYVSLIFNGKSSCKTGNAVFVNSCDERPHGHWQD